MGRSRSRARRVSSYFAGLMLSLALALATGYVLLRPPMADLAQLALQLSATAGLTFVAGYAAHRWHWLHRAPRLSYALFGSYVLATVLAILNVWISARLMFLNEHDLLLGSALLVFAGGIAIALGGFFSEALTERLEQLRRFATELTSGRLDTRVAVSGRDEVADLARSLNLMAQQLEDARSRQEAMDAMRRELMTWVGHDLRTPLASVQAIVEALADGLVDEPAARERYLRTAQRDIQALSSLIDDLFEMAQIEAGGLDLHLREGSVSDLVSDTLEAFLPLAAAAGISLEASAEPGLDPILMDAQRVARVLSNLLSNALRHTPAGGTIGLHATRDAEGACLSVSDTGEGIASPRLEHIFDRSYHPGPSRGGSRSGSGLGLAIARGIVEAHGGRIGIESEVGRGTRVELRLPGRKAPVKALAAAPGPRDLPRPEPEVVAQHPDR